MDQLFNTKILSIEVNFISLKFDNVSYVPRFSKKKNDDKSQN